MNLTEKFPLSILPVHDGVYEVGSDKTIGYHYSLFENGIWHTSCGSVLNASTKKETSLNAYNGIYSFWRGVDKVI